MSGFEMESAPNKFDLKEDSFLLGVAQLPKEFKAEWQQRYEAVEDESAALELFEAFSEFKFRRKEALDKDTLEIHPDVVSPEVLRQISEVQDSIRHSFGRGEFFLGNGASAEVYILPIAPVLAVKHITNQSAYNENNHIRTEYNFLDKLHNFSSAGIRTPQPYFTRIHPTEGHSYGMERIDGENLSRILEEPRKNIEFIKILKTLDRAEVEQNLIAYVTELQEKFRISHNDLFRRNIMVDKDANFYIIDFGKARTEEVGEDHEMKFSSDLATVRSEVRGFFMALDKIDIELYT